MNDTSRLSAALAGRYAIEREIGRGGMATVYLARDVKHDRHVALKVLDPELGAVLGAERFLTEIRVTANLQHPNLLPLFDSGEADGLLFYVMPFVEGESLRHRLTREKQLPIDEAIHVATGIANALDYAHQHGIIHRDLKPENILLQHGQPVVADFGIALAVVNAGGQRITQTGLSLGTPQYMSPEQATGDRGVDNRTDIYSLGVVTYEMLAGEPPHVSATAQGVIAKLMTEAPRPITVLRPTVPEHVDDAIRRALEKVPADRFATAAQFAAALADAPTLHRATRTTRRAPRRALPRSVLIALGATSVAALVFAGLWARAAARPDSRMLQFVLDIPADQQITVTNESAVRLSPDGGTLAYVARTKSSAAEIFIRPLDSLGARSEAIGMAMAPLFSADGRWMFYKSPGDIRRVPVHGGSPEVVTSIGNWQGYALAKNGAIAFAADGSIWRVGDKGEHVRLVAPDSTKGEQSYAMGSFLDDNTLAFWIQRYDNDQGNALGITTMNGGEHSVLNLPMNRTIGMLDGHLLVGVEKGTLLAYPLNLRRRELTGPPVVLLDSVVWTITGGLQLSLAQDGTLAYLRGRSGRSLAIVDKRGQTIAEAPERLPFGRAALSPDGKRVAVTIARNTTGGRNVQTSDVWIWDVDAKALARFTVDGGSNPAWSADGKRIAFLHRTSPTHTDIMWAPTDGSAPAEMLVEIPQTLRILSFSFARGGREVLVDAESAPAANSDIYSVDLTARDRALHPIAATRFGETAPAVSPDGKWLAYISNETGRAEVYVRPYASPAGRIRVSANGGGFPQWLASGSRLVYTDAGHSLVAEISESGGSITAVTRDSVSREGTRHDIDGKGDRILVTRDPPEWRIVVVKNWIQEARKKLHAR